VPDAGLNEQEAPAGRFEQESATDVGEPLFTVIIIVFVAGLPWVTSTFPEFDIAKENAG
jgi:hypothetical protein